MDAGVDDGGQGRNSRATFTPTAAGAFYVEAASFGVTGTYTLSVREVVQTDATLIALMVNDGSSDLTLTPAFASGTYAYAVSVANAVDEVTVTPTTNQAAATIAWLDADDNALDDADTSTGQQVALAEGANVIHRGVADARGGGEQRGGHRCRRPGDGGRRRHGRHADLQPRGGGRGFVRHRFGHGADQDGDGGDLPARGETPRCTESGEAPA